jgi:hypothetical protein
MMGLERAKKVRRRKKEKGRIYSVMLWESEFYPHSYAPLVLNENLAFFFRARRTGVMGESYGIVLDSSITD